MPLIDQIRDLIGSYYDGEIGVRDFREKFAVFLIKSDQSDPETENLALAVEGTYAEYVAHLIEEEQLKKRLFELAPSVRLQIEVNGPKLAQPFWILTSTAAENRPSPIAPSSQSWKSTSSAPPQPAEPCLSS